MALIDDKYEELVQFGDWLRSTSTLAESSIEKYRRSVRVISQEMLDAKVIGKSFLKMSAAEIDAALPIVFGTDEFIEKIRTAVKRVSPEKFLLGEVWEDATTKFGFDHRRTYLLGKGLDSVMNYPFKNAVLDFVKGKPAEQAMGEILSICEHYPAPAMDTALNFLSTHDTERALTVIAPAASAR